MPRQQLNERQAATVQRLLDAGLAQLAEVGPEALTVRQVAVRAGVSPATAYTYFSSKNHLLAELFHRAIVDQTPPVSGAGERRRPRAGRHQGAERPVRTQPARRRRSQRRAAGLGPGRRAAPVADGGEFVTRFDDALGESSTPELVDVLVLAFSEPFSRPGWA